MVISLHRLFLGNTIDFPCVYCRVPQCVATHDAGPWNCHINCQKNNYKYKRGFHKSSYICYIDYKHLSATYEKQTQLCRSIGTHVSWIHLVITQVLGMQPTLGRIFHSYITEFDGTLPKNPTPTVWIWGSHDDFQYWNYIGQMWCNMYWVTLVFNSFHGLPPILHWKKTSWFDHI